MASNNKTTKHLRRTRGEVTERSVGRDSGGMSPDIPRSTELSTEVDTTFSALSLSVPDSGTESCTGYTLSSRNNVRKHSLTSLPCVTLPSRLQRQDTFSQPHEAISMQTQSPVHKKQYFLRPETNSSTCSEETTTMRNQSEEQQTRQTSNATSPKANHIARQSASSTRPLQQDKALAMAGESKRECDGGLDEGSETNGCELTPESSLRSSSSRNSSCAGKTHSSRDVHDGERHDTGLAPSQNRPTIYEMTTDLSDSILATYFRRGLAEVSDPRAVWDITIRCVEDLAQLVDSDNSAGYFHAAFKQAAGYEASSGATDHTGDIQGDSRLGTSRKRTYEDQQSGDGEDGSPPDDDNGDRHRDRGGGQDKRQKPETRQANRMACPFTKRNVSRFNIRTHEPCWGGFSDISSLKTHIKAFHKRDCIVTLPFPCPRCGERYSSETEVIAHLSRDPRCPSHEFRPGSSIREDPEDGITAEIAKMLGERKNDHKISTWNDVWLAIFPNDDKIPPSDLEPRMTFQEMVIAFEKTQPKLEAEIERLVQILGLEEASADAKRETSSRFSDIIQDTLSQSLRQFKDDIENVPATSRRRRSQGTKATPDIASRDDHALYQQPQGLPPNPRHLLPNHSRTQPQTKRIQPKQSSEGDLSSMQQPLSTGPTDILSQFSGENGIGAHQLQYRQPMPPPIAPRQPVSISTQFEIQDDQSSFAKDCNNLRDSGIELDPVLAAQLQSMQPHNPNMLGLAGADMSLSSPEISCNFSEQYAQSQENQVGLPATGPVNLTPADIIQLYHYNNLAYGQDGRRQ